MKTGDRVVCIKTHSQWAVKKGVIYTIRNIIKATCCGSTKLDVGIRAIYSTHGCGCCGHTRASGSYWPLSPDLFAPIVEDEFLSSDEIDKVVEEKIDIKIPVEA